MDGGSYDAIVVGGGPAGYVAAIRLGQLGMRALCVERESLGGVCLNWGCIPSKALIHAAGRWEGIRGAEEMGIAVEGARLDLRRTQAWKAGIVQKLTGSVGALVRGSGGDIASGTARLLGPRAVEVRDAAGRATVHEAGRAVVVATGASLARVPGLEPDGERILTAREAVDLTGVPGRLVVVGGGVIGLELGMLYQRLGSALTVVELTDGLLPGVDRDLVRVVEARLRKRGARVLTGARAAGWEPRGDGGRLRVEHGGGVEEVDFDRLLVAAGFRPNSGGLGLEEVGVALDARGHVVVDDGYRTSVPGVYAIGDVAGPPYLAHKAFKEAEIAAEVIAGRRVRRDWQALPMTIFTDPEVAVVGMGEEEARRAVAERGGALKVGRFPFAALGRALSLGDTDGFVKVLADEDRVLGVGIVGPEASELVAEAALALEMAASAEDVALTIHAHPTLGEAMGEAFKHALGEAVHVRNRRPAAAV